MGVSSCKRCNLRLWERRISNVELDARDSKTRLQEWAQARQLEPPVYTLINRSGPDHSPIFKIQVKLQTGEKPLRRLAISETLSKPQLECLWKL